MTFLWITKTSKSKSLSRSEGQEQLDILSQAQRVSRRQKTLKRKRQVCKSKVLDPISCERDLHGMCDFPSIYHR